ncbi:ABC transporter permease [Falsiroseomonas selenitidurans]|uniref:ABC transporter permease n=1 Tax=Falsiroseomonas selenitidurans TaxID=2716335 RepID=A0ABX1DXZ2_9PROT|nr:ABC transporter permease [Falsiroseomonas selenitidurans]NKC29235.1 ABC transporter permease [Falsiroseomonas selenitidurans]OYW10195.1 MAG: diguanylate cyclase [Rhodospirillales bacterium 12-71-4]
MSATAASPAAPAAPPARGESPTRRAIRRFVRHRLALAGFIVVLAFVLVAALAPWIAPYDPIATSWSRIRKPPSELFWFGTDENGRDVLSRMIWGARASLMAGVISVLGAVLLGVPVGLLAGLAGGWVDAVISRIADAMLSIPFLILAIALAAFLGPALENAMLAIAITASPVFVRLSRGMALDAKSTDWVEAARSLGNPPWRTAFVHVLPNIVPPLLVQSTLSIAEAIIAEASLSFLGLGQQPPAPSWGSMLNSAQRFLETAPWLAIAPGAAIFVVVLAFNLMGDGLRDALDPRADRR